jgi:hypothetical protein
MHSMSEAKPFASLSSALLARKGHAKPAMRPQAFQLPQDYPATAQQHEHDDLGWNDMGHDHVPAEPVALHGEPVRVPTEPPVVVAQQEQLTREFPEPELVAPELVVPTPQPATLTELPRDATPVTLAVPAPMFAPAPRAAAGSKAKAAFTLRLDADRHLRLRMLSAVSHRSAQQIVTQALDEFLDGKPGSNGPTFQTKISSGDDQ